LSYGAYLGATYANLFPAKVRALVLDGVPDPVAWATGRGDEGATWPLFNRVGSAEGASATLGEFLRLCDQAGSACAFSQGDPRRRYQALARRLLANPAQTPHGPVGYADLVYATLRALQDPAGWPELAERLQQLDSLTRHPTAAATRLGTSQPDYPKVLEGLAGVACSDSDNPDRVDAWQRAAAAADRAAPYFGRYWTWFSASASHGPDATPTATPAPGRGEPPTRSWSSATGSTRPAPTGERSPWPACSPDPGCSP
jgi:pimeloyl-ACP methyl ester carboxylesterase